MKIKQTFLFETDFLWTNKTLTIIYSQKIVRYLCTQSRGDAYIRRKRLNSTSDYNFLRLDASKSILETEKTLKTLSSGQIYKKSQKNPLGWFFLNRVFSNHVSRRIRTTTFAPFPKRSPKISAAKSRWRILPKRRRPDDPRKWTRSRSTGSTSRRAASRWVSFSPSFLPCLLSSVLPLGSMLIGRRGITTRRRMMGRMMLLMRIRLCCRARRGIRFSRRRSGLSSVPFCPPFFGGFISSSCQLHLFAVQATFCAPAGRWWKCILTNLYSNCHPWVACCFRDK